MGTKAVSTKITFFNGRRYRPGQVFELPDGYKLGPEMKEVVGDVVPKIEGEQLPPQPETFSEMNNPQSKTLKLPKGTQLA